MKFNEPRKSIYNNFRTREVWSKGAVFVCCMLLSSNCFVATVNLTNKQFLRKSNE
jgi:uncharacterized membrane protein